MAERRVSVKFSAEIQGFKSAMEEAARATEKTKKATEDAGKAADTHLGKMVQSATKNSDAWERTGAVTATAGAAMVAGVGLAVKSFADFDKQMSSVDAATHESAANMTLLRDAAVKAGADTAFSAVEAAQGIEELAKAGVSTKDILDGGLDGSLALAAAGSLGVGEAAEIAASALTQFKLSGDKVPHVADLLAAGAGKAQGSVSDLGAALNQSGLVAASTGLTIEETTGSLAAFASAGLTGSDAGTSFKTMLMSLNPNSKEAAKLMEDLGISAYDAQGNFIGMSEYAGVLQNALKGMSDEQRNATLKTLFGSDAVRAANVLYEQGAAGINKWEAAVNDAGYAADTAARMQNNLAGDIEKLGGSIDSVFLKSGSGANDFLRGLAQGAEDAVDWIGQIPGPVLGAAAGITGLVGVAALGAGAFLNFTPKILETKLALDQLAPAGSRARSTLSTLGRVASGAAVGIAAVGAASIAAQPAIDNLYKPTGETADALKKFSGEAAQGAVSAGTLGESFEDLIQKQDGVKSFQSAIDGIADPGLWGNIDNIATQGIGLLSLGMIKAESTSERARDRFKTFGDTLASLDPAKASASFQSMAKETNGSEESLKRLLDYMPSYRKSLEDQAQAAGKATDDQTLLGIAMGTIEAKATGAASGIKVAGEAAAGATAPTEEVAAALEELGVNAQGAIVDLAKFTDALFAAGLLQLSARDASRAWSQAMLDLGLQADGTGGAVGALGTAFDNTTAQGIKNQAMFDATAQAGIRNAQAMAQNGASQEELQGALGVTYNGLIAAAGQFGITGDAAVNLARDVLKVPKGVSIESWMSEQAKITAQNTKGAMDAIDGRVVRTYTEHQEKTIRIIETQTRGSDNPSDVGLRPGSLAPGGATGGRVADILGFWGGGRLPYARPSDMTKDNLIGYVNGGRPIALQGQEWVTNGKRSDEYDTELQMIHNGTLPKFKEYSAQSLGYMPAGVASASAATPPDVRVFIGNEQIDARIEYVSSRGLARTDADTQRFRTGGR